MALGRESRIDENNKTDRVGKGKKGEKMKVYFKLERSRGKGKGMWPLIVIFSLVILGLILTIERYNNTKA